MTPVTTTPSDLPIAAGSGSGALTAEEQERAHRILLIFARAGAAITVALQQRLGADYGSNVEILILSSLDLRGPQRPADIVALTGLTSGGVTKVLDRMEVQGLLTRQIGGVHGDRRGTRLALTPEGHRVASELAAGLISRMDVVRTAIADLLELAGD